MLCGGRALVGEHGFDPGAKTFLIELECSLTFAVEMEIRAHLHVVLLIGG
jgi:hypothetical protein